MGIRRYLYLLSEIDLGIRNNTLSFLFSITTGVAFIFLIAAFIIMTAMIFRVYNPNRAFESRCSVNEGENSIFIPMFTVFSSAAAAMGCQICAISIYQARYGSLYSHIGVLTALFMIGFTGGAYIAGRNSPMPLAKYRANINFPASIYGISLGILAPAALLASFELTQTYAGLLTAASIFINGLGAGMILPGVSRGIKNIMRPDETASAWLPAALDSSGAVAGVFFTGIFMVIQWGFWNFLVYNLIFRVLLLVINYSLCTKHIREKSFEEDSGKLC